MAMRMAKGNGSREGSPPCNLRRNCERGALLAAAFRAVAVGFAVARFSFCLS